MATWVLSTIHVVQVLSARSSHWCAKGRRSGLRLEDERVEPLASGEPFRSQSCEFSELGDQVRLIAIAEVVGHVRPRDAEACAGMRQSAFEAGEPAEALGADAHRGALWLSLLLIGSFRVRRHIGGRVWRMLHYASFLAFGFASVHGLALGSESTTVWATLLYLGTLAPVLFLCFYRVLSLKWAVRFAPYAGVIHASKGADR